MLWADIVYNLYEPAPTRKRSKSDPKSEVKRAKLFPPKSRLLKVLTNTREKQSNDVMERIAAAAAAAGQTESEPKKKKAKPSAPVPRTSFSSREGETELERRQRVRNESATRRERDSQQRTDDRRRSSALQLQPAEGILQPSWRLPPAEHTIGETAVERARRVDRYFECLSELGDSFHKCPNCKQRGVDHINLGDGQYCALCVKTSSEERTDHGKRLHESNGLNLDVRGAEDWQRDWAKLKLDHGELSPTEEALISPVQSLTAVLQLPSGQQLGYRGSIINFVNETASVAQQLPRAPRDANIIVYRVRGKAGTHRGQRLAISLTHLSLSLT